MSTQNGLTRANQDARIPRPIRRLTALAGLALAFGLPTVGAANDYPNGANTVGVVNQVMTFGGNYLLFVVQGTLDNGSTGQQAFWIKGDTADSGFNVRVANILAAAAQGRTVQIWNYGESFSNAGQGGYISAAEFVKY